ATFDALGIPQHRAARLFNVTSRSIRRWQHGDRRVPRGIAIVFRLLAAGVITIDQVEQAAVSVPARTNGSAKGEPPAEPASGQSALARVEAAAPANSSLTVAERVLALVPGVCRWPCGDLGHPDFHFCGAPVVTTPYCERHRARAYLAPRTGNRHGVRVGFVVHGRHGRPSIPGTFSATGASRAPKVLFDRAGDLPGSVP